MPNIHPDVIGHFIHFVVEIMCKKVHRCARIDWIMSPLLARRLRPQLDALAAREDDVLRERYANYLEESESKSVYTCSVADYRTPPQLQWLMPD